ncbi:HNH endonuclease family protein [Williamsia deligens]|nr:Protein of unknown function (DUF1524) [Williamsia deligens]
MRAWITLAVCAALAVVVAAQTVTSRPPRGPRVDAGPALAVLAQIATVPTRVHRDDYDRTAFGPAWADGSQAASAGNGCDTRDDILDRDLTDKTYVATPACPRAVAAGEMHSPYTGDFIAFRRGRDSGGTVQIDHIVPLAYAWDMGASGWDAPLRLTFANDPANLVAVDGRSNQDKSDSPPGEWLPRRRSFRCRYAVQFVVVTATYRLTVDARSAGVLRSELRRC